MRWAQCQHENRPQAKFCEECAAQLAPTCANCGTQLSATAKFCPECAHPVTGGRVAQPRFASPESYTPKHLAEKILTSKSALEGERTCIESRASYCSGRLFQMKSKPNLFSKSNRGCPQPDGKIVGVAGGNEFESPVAKAR